MPTGAVAVSLYSIQISAGGDQVYGDVLISLPAITSSVEGFPGEAGTCEITLPSIDLVSIGSTELNDTKITIPKIGISSTGKVGILSREDQTNVVIPGIVVSASGRTAFSSGDVKIIVPNIEVSSAGFSEFSSGSGINIIVPKLEVSSTGRTAILGNCEISIPSISIDAGSSYTYGDASISLPSVRSSGYGFSGIEGTCEISIPVISVSSSGIEEAVGTVIIEIPIISIAASGKQELITDHVDIDSSTDKTYVMNISNRSITEYINFNFNSYCRFNGVYFGAKADGIYLLGGDTGETTLIKSNIRFPAYNIQKPSVQRPREVWATFRSNGQLVLTVRLGEDETWENIFPIVSDYIDEARVVLAKGFKTSTYEFGIKNVGGSNFDLESIRVMVDDLRSGKR